MIADIVSPDEELNLISYASEPEDNGQDKSRPRAGEGIERRNASWMTFVSVFSMMYFPLGVGPAFHFTGMIPGKYPRAVESARQLPVPLTSFFPP